MKRATITICAAVFLFACNSADKSAGDAKTDDAKVASASTNEAAADNLPDSVKQKNWMEYMTPGKEHQMMASWDGEWTGQASMWMQPGAPPSTSTVNSVNKMVLGGRYQQSINTGNMMGQPFEGISLMGYDNAKKKFISTWADNMGTGIMNSEGTWDEATKTLTFTGTCINPETRKECTIRQVMKITDENNQIMEMYGPGPDGKEFKNMEIRLSRKK